MVLRSMVFARANVRRWGANVLIVTCLFALLQPAVMRSAAADGAPSQGTAPGSGPVAVSAYRVRAALAPDTHWLAAQAEVSLTVNRAARQLVLSLNPALTVQSLTVAGKSAAFSRNDARLTIDLPAQAQAGDTVRVAIDYAGEVISRGWGLRGHIGPEGIFLAKEAWLPCDETWSSEVPAELTVDLPAGYTLVNRGRVEGRELLGNRQVLHLQTSDLNVIAGVYDYRRIIAGQTAVDLYTYAAYPEVGRILADEIPRAFAFLRRTLGEAPIDSLVIVNMPAVPGFGSGVAYGDVIGLTPDFRNARGYDVYALLPHELTHRWQQARLRSFTGPGSVWLIEATATYVSWMYLAERFGPERFRDALSQGAEIARRDRLIDGAGSVLACESKRADLRYGPVYLRGAWALHRLRQLIGEEKFAEYLRQHLDWRAKDLDDWVALCSRLAGFDLKPYFDRWLREDDPASPLPDGPTGALPPQDRPDLTAEDGQLVVQYDPTKPSLVGTASMALHNHLGRRPSFRLSLNTGLTVTSVVVRGRPAPFIQSARDLLIMPPGGLADDERFTVVINYAGWPVAIGAAPLPANGALPARALWYPSLTDLGWPGRVAIRVPTGVTIARIPGWERRSAAGTIELTPGGNPTAIDLVPTHGSGMTSAAVVASAVVLLAVGAAVARKRKRR